MVLDGDSSFAIYMVIATVFSEYLLFAVLQVILWLRHKRRWSKLSNLQLHVTPPSRMFRSFQSELDRAGVSAELLDEEWEANDFKVSISRANDGLSDQFEYSDLSSQRNEGSFAGISDRGVEIDRENKVSIFRKSNFAGRKE